MIRWFRARAFSVLWNVGDWALGMALRLDDSEKQLHWVGSSVDWAAEAEEFVDEIAEMNPPRNTTNGSANHTTVTCTKLLRWS